MASGTDWHFHSSINGLISDQDMDKNYLQVINYSQKEAGKIPCFFRSSIT
jgi:hypothetical protein